MSIKYDESILYVWANIIFSETYEIHSNMS